MISEDGTNSISSEHSVCSPDTLFSQDTIVSIKSENGIVFDNSPCPQIYSNNKDFDVFTSVLANDTDDDESFNLLMNSANNDDDNDFSMFNPSETQMSITKQSKDISLVDEDTINSCGEIRCNSDDDEAYVSKKARKHSLSDSPSLCSSPSLVSSIASKLFYDSTANTSFVFKQFGSKEILTNGKDLPLNYPNLLSKCGDMELIILNQPELQHRARYLTEGSRGAIKDRDGNGNPKVQLIGYKGKENLILQVFIGVDQGKIKPHPFYHACPVSGKNQDHCSERDINGTKVIEIPLEASSNFTAVTDCVGILKLRNADVEKTPEQKPSKKKTSKARLVFRVCIPSDEGKDFIVLQIASQVISCTQPTGQPEIIRKDLDCLPVVGNLPHRDNRDMFIIGKNFVKGTSVYFTFKDWRSTAKVDSETFHQNHMVITVPEFYDSDINEPVTVTMIIESGIKQSDPILFTYLPIETKNCHLMDTNQSPITSIQETPIKSISCASPEAQKIQEQYMLDSLKTINTPVLKDLLITKTTMHQSNVPTLSQNMDNRQKVISNPQQTVADILQSIKMKNDEKCTDLFLKHLSTELVNRNFMDFAQTNSNGLINHIVQSVSNGPKASQAYNNNYNINNTNVVNSPQTLQTTIPLQDLLKNCNQNVTNLNNIGNNLVKPITINNQVSVNQQQPLILTTQIAPTASLNNNTPIIILPSCNQNFTMGQVIQGVILNGAPQTVVAETNINSNDLPRVSTSDVDRLLK